MLRKNSVTDQNPDNLLKLTRGETGCCGDDAVDCQSTATYVQANSVSVLNVTEAGIATAIPVVIAGAATAATAKAAIEAALIAAGYYEDDNADFAGVTVTDTGTDLVVVLTGDIVPVSLVTSGGTVTFASNCTLTGICTFAEVGFTAGTASALHINGVEELLGTITPGTTGAPAVKTAIDTALGNQGITYTLVTVTTTGSGSSQTYNVSITGVPPATTLYLIGNDEVRFYLEKGACSQVYV